MLRIQWWLVRSILAQVCRKWYGHVNCRNFLLETYVFFPCNFWPHIKALSGITYLPLFFWGHCAFGLVRSSTFESKVTRFCSFILFLGVVPNWRRLLWTLVGDYWCFLHSFKMPPWIMELVSWTYITFLLRLSFR